MAGHWKLWFAWRPVWCLGVGNVWLRFVHRRRIGSSYEYCMYDEGRLGQ